jgi:hypothetical protein
MLNVNNRTFTALSASLILSSLLAFGLPSETIGASPAGIEGTWSGAGTVHLSGGETEKVRCRADIRKHSAGVFAMSATCATASVRVKQNAVLDQAGPNRYVGTFVNDEYGITGSIRVTLKGNSITAALAAPSVSAVLAMSR